MPIDDAFASLPNLVTPRLRLRQVQPADAEALFAIKADPAVTAAYGQEPHRALSGTEVWIERLGWNYARREVLFWCLTSGDTDGPIAVDGPIGSVTFWNPGPGWLCAELGYELNRAYWGQGLMAEALPAVLTYGFDEVGLHRVEACPLAGNTASLNLLRKLGFTGEGTLRQRVPFRGEFHDQVYFGLLREEWGE